MSEYGAMEGVVIALTAYQTFTLRDILNGRWTECVFKPDMLDQVVAALGKRTVVTGDIYPLLYAEGMGIRVKRIDIRPPEETLPTFKDITGLLADPKVST